MKKLLHSLALMLLLSTAPATAQNLSLGGSESLEVDAQEGIEWRQADKSFIARGNAIAKRGNLSVAADQLTALYRDETGETEIYRIEADGNVVIRSNTETVVGERAVYDLDQTVAIVTGRNLRLTTPTDLVTAERSLEYHEARGFAVARGNATITRENRTLRAETITATFSQDQSQSVRVSRVNADGDVTIVTTDEVVRGQTGVYDVDRALVTLEGSVKITRGQNQLNGDYAEVNLATGISRLSTRPGGARVQGLFIPTPRSKPAQ